MLGKFSLLSLVSPDTFSCLPITSREIYLCTGSVQQAWYIFLLTHSIKVDISIYWLLSNLPDPFPAYTQHQIRYMHAWLLSHADAIHGESHSQQR